MAGQGWKEMSQDQLNDALFDACGRDNDQARAEEPQGVARLEIKDTEGADLACP